MTSLSLAMAVICFMCSVDHCRGTQETRSSKVWV